MKFLSQEIPRKFTKIESIKTHIRKIEFFLSYIKDYPDKLCFIS